MLNYLHRPLLNAQRGSFNEGAQGRPRITVNRYNYCFYSSVDSDVTVIGSSYNNQSGRVANVSIIDIGTRNKITDSGSGNFIGTINAPGYDATISGTGSYSGAIIANTLTISGGAGLHYDEALRTGGSASIGNYAFASWFEDNSDPNPQGCKPKPHRLLA
jgi:hypothetical protein